MLHKLFKSILEQDTAPVVVCDTADIIVYMNPAAIRSYHNDLTGQSIKDCHPKDANQKIDLVLSWFYENKENNIVYLYHNEKHNKDVYMVALRDEDGILIGYYEKHECRNRERKSPYEF